MAGQQEVTKPTHHLHHAIHFEEELCQHDAVLNSGCMMYEDTGNISRQHPLPPSVPHRRVIPGLSLKQESFATQEVQRIYPFNIRGFTPFSVLGDPGDPSIMKVPIR